MNRQYLLQTLRSHLQTAVEIEHATLPPYLMAYWSIYGDSAHAKKASSLILSVIREEMLHMGIACNILSAVGGTPSTNGKNFVPCFPCYLPGHSHTINPFIVHLAPCNADSVKTFMQIELPEKEIRDNPQHKKWATIGQFYDEIIAIISDPLLSDSDFRHGIQIGNDANPAKGILYKIDCRDDAIKAIKEILDQGEGHSKKSHHDQDHELTHYWKFKEVFNLIESGKWNISDDIYPVAENPDENLFTEQAKQLNRTFNIYYSALLDAICDAYSGKGSIDDSIDYMLKLESIARQLMQIPLNGKAGNAGPTFQYVESSMRVLPSGNS